ncbi:MAG TPA: 1-acyl-sn-glycerol-3-phosphate acyltransferase [Candidatus Scybalocola faecavium]|nr:1-acyl-sn-glycerol-3-phosphate acyltransferase [Candidatus Scybalocola faecavium]
MDKYRRQLTKKEEPHSPGEEEHIVKMWTPLHFCTPVGYDYFPKSRLFITVNFLLRQLVYVVGPVIFKVFFGLRVVHGDRLKTLPQKGVTVCNHVHMLDCGVVACHMGRRRICIPTLESNFCIPGIRWLVRLLGGIPLPGKVQPFRQMNEALTDYINKGHLVHVYPEGILYPRYNGIRTFKRGAFSLAYECNVPVIPYVIRYVEPEGLERIFHRKKVMRLYILDPVYPDTKKNKKEETLRLCDEVRRKMEEVFTKNNP